VDDAKGESGGPTPAQSLAAEIEGGPDASGKEPRGKGDGIAMQIQHEGGQHVALRTADAELCGPQHGSGGLRGVEFTVDNIIAHGGPTDFTTEFDIQAVAAKQPQLVRGDEGRGIGQRNETQPESLRAAARESGGMSGSHEKLFKRLACQSSFMARELLRNDFIPNMKFIHP